MTNAEFSGAPGASRAHLSGLACCGHAGARPARRRECGGGGAQTWMSTRTGRARASGGTAVVPGSSLPPLPHGHAGVGSPRAMTAGHRRGGAQHHLWYKRPRSASNIRVQTKAASVAAQPDRFWPRTVALPTPLAPSSSGGVRAGCGGPPSGASRRGDQRSSHRSGQGGAARRAVSSTQGAGVARTSPAAQGTAISTTCSAPYETPRLSH